MCVGGRFLQIRSHIDLYCTHRVNLQLEYIDQTAYYADIISTSLVPRHVKL